jgi:hypothetical protein
LLRNSENVWLLASNVRPSKSADSDAGAASDEVVPIPSILNIKLCHIWQSLADKFVIIYAATQDTVVTAGLFTLNISRL